MSKHSVIVSVQINLIKARKKNFVIRKSLKMIYNQAIKANIFLFFVINHIYACIPANLFRYERINVIQDCGEFTFKQLSICKFCDNWRRRKKTEK